MNRPEQFFEPVQHIHSKDSKQERFVHQSDIARSGHRQERSKIQSSLFSCAMTHTACFPLTAHK